MSRYSVAAYTASVLALMFVVGPSVVAAGVSERSAEASAHLAFGLTLLCIPACICCLLAAMICVALARRDGEGGYRLAAAGVLGVSAIVAVTLVVRFV